MSRAIIIGGGIIGLSSAYYLRESGWEVTVLDRSDFSDNCSYGNAGYICPSHFVPLATPGIVKQGLKWMLNSKSPFYIKPRLNKSLIDWGFRFMRSATPEHVERSAIPLRDIALLSQVEYEKWNQVQGLEFSYEKRGLLELFQTPEAFEHAAHLAKKAVELGLAGTRMLSVDELREMEPGVPMVAKGALYFPGDAHCYPNKLMKKMLVLLDSKGVELRPGEEAVRFEMQGEKITKVITRQSSFNTDAVVLATGSWSRQIAERMGISIPLMPGRGYSVTLTDSPYRIKHPYVLVEGRVAITPMDGNKIRFGGTMEITPIGTPPRMSRVEGILQAVKKYFPSFDIPKPSPDQVWYGYRPCSPDGLPFIGRSQKWNNLIVATGHAMVGLSLGAGTGRLAEEILNEKQLSMDISPFRVERFNGKNV